MKLPDMPEPWVELDAKVRGEWGHQVLYSADQMRSFFELGYKMGREDAAKADEEEASIYLTPEQRKEHQRVINAARRAMVDNIAVAIRRQGEQG